GNVAQSNLLEPLPPLLLPRDVENAPSPGLTIKLEESLDRQAALPQQVMQVVMGPVEYINLLPALFEVVSARQGRQDGESHPIQLVFVHEIPQALKICLGKIRIDNEIPGDAKPEFAGNTDGFYGLVDVGILVQRTEA